MVDGGNPPPASTRYHIDANTQIQLPESAAQRLGVQPVVTLSARVAEHGEDGEHAPPGAKVDVKIGQPVIFSIKAEMPPGGGEIVRVEWDFEDTTKFPFSTPLTHAGREVNLHRPFTFTRPGTYFPVVRVTSQRDGERDGWRHDGDTGSPYGLIQNLASVRVVVH